MKKSLLLCAVILSSVPGWADAKYTKKTTYNSEGMPAGYSMQTVVYLKGKRERRETLTDMGQMKMKQIELTLCDKELRASVDDDLKIYSSSSLRPELTPATPTKPANQPKGAGGTGTYKLVYTVKDLGVEKVSDLKAHHYRIKMDVTTTGCAGDSHTTNEREVWVANLPHLVCPVRDATTDFSLDKNCKIKVTQSGDVKLFQQAMQGEPVKEIFYQNGKPLMTTEVTQYSTAPLSDALFSLDGLKSVSDSEFQQMQQQKMMQQFQQPQQGPPEQPDDEQ